jgi:hypothetical protein
MSKGASKGQGRCAFAFGRARHDTWHTPPLPGWPLNPSSAACPSHFPLRHTNPPVWSGLVPPTHSSRPPHVMLVGYGGPQACYCGACPPRVPTTGAPCWACWDSCRWGPVRCRTSRCLPIPCRGPPACRVGLGAFTRFDRDKLCRLVAGTDSTLVQGLTVKVGGHRGGQLYRHPLSLRCSS